MPQQLWKWLQLLVGVFVMDPSINCGAVEELHTATGASIHAANASIGRQKRGENETRLRELPEASTTTTSTEDLVFTRTEHVESDVTIRTTSTEARALPSQAVDLGSMRPTKREASTIALTAKDAHTTTATSHTNPMTTPLQTETTASPSPSKWMEPHSSRRLAAYVDGPRVGNSAWKEHCSAWTGSLSNAKANCDADSSCSVLFDLNCRGTTLGWRFCWSTIDIISSADASTRACTLLAIPQSSTSTTETSETTESETSQTRTPTPTSTSSSIYSFTSQSHTTTSTLSSFSHSSATTKNVASRTTTTFFITVSATTASSNGVEPMATHASTTSMNMFGSDSTNMTTEAGLSQASTTSYTTDSQFNLTALLSILSRDVVTTTVAANSTPATFVITSSIVLLVPKAEQFVSDPEVGAATAETFDALAGVPAGTAVANLRLAVPEVSAGTTADFVPEGVSNSSSAGGEGRRVPAARGLVVVDYEIGLPVALPATQAAQTYAAILRNMAAVTPEEVTLVLLASLQKRRPWGVRVNGLALANTNGSMAEMSAADYYAPTVIEILEPLMRETSPESTPAHHSNVPAAFGRHARFWFAGGLGIGFALLCCLVGKACAAGSPVTIPPKPTTEAGCKDEITLNKVAAISWRELSLDSKSPEGLESPCCERSGPVSPGADAAARVGRAPPPSPKGDASPEGLAVRRRSPIRAGDLMVALTQLADRQPPSPSQASDGTITPNERSEPTKTLPKNSERGEPGLLTRSSQPAGELAGLSEQVAMRHANMSVAQADLLRRNTEQSLQLQSRLGKDNGQEEQHPGCQRARSGRNPHEDQCQEPGPTGIPTESHVSVAMARHTKFRSGAPLSPSAGWKRCSTDRAARHEVRQRESRRTPDDSCMPTPRISSFFI